MYNILIRSSNFIHDIESKQIVIYSKKEKERFIASIQRHKKDDGTYTEFYAFEVLQSFDLTCNSYCSIAYDKAIKNFAKKLGKVYKYNVCILDILRISFDAIDEKNEKDYDNFIKQCDKHKYDQGEV